MTDQTIKILVGIAAFLALFIKIPKVEVPIWKWILKGVGDAINGSLTAKIASLSEQITEVDKLLNEHIKTQHEAEVTACRRRILRFDDEARMGIKHSSEHWENIMEDCDQYRRYCREHDDYPNSKAEKAMAHLDETYRALNPQDFL